MSTTAEELLNSLTEEEITAYTANPEEEPHIIVDENRKITVPDELKRIAVQYDHNIETVTFDCIRYWDGHDMSTMHVYINYMLNNKALGSYLAETVTVDEENPDIIHFTWTISRNVTQAVGPITFLVCIKRTDGEGNEINHWNSELNKEMFVNQGLECGEPIVEDYPDVIGKILLNINDLNNQNKYPAWERYKDKDGRYEDDDGVPIGGVCLYGVIESGGYIPAPYAVNAGLDCRTSGVSSFAQGVGCESTGRGSLTFGTYSKSSGAGSAAFGVFSEATADGQFVIGRYNEPDSGGQYAFIIGNGTDYTRSNALTVDWDGNLSVKGGIMSIGDGNSVESSEGHGGGLLALGSNNTASGMYSVAIGRGNTASNSYSIAIGDNNTASGYYSFALGQNLIASGKYQTVIGANNKEEPYDYVFIIGNGPVDGSDEDRSNAIAVDWNGHLEISGGIKTLGMSNDLSENESDPGYGGVIAMGDRNCAYGLYSVAIGTICSSRGSYSLSIGNNCDSSGDCSIAMGKNCSTDYNSENIGHYAISMGENNGSYGKNSVTIGKELTTFIDNQTVIGKYNDYSNDAIRTYAFVIGNGTDAYNNRSNALTVDWDGNAVFAGDVTATTQNGTKISFIDIYNKIGLIEEKLSTLVTPEGTA